eukprot:comp24665_c0_seq1/m.46828 comp24665_c0_seq1/g.46828  ORF comp24665_c0_seq1/g.46828 comp24665_c0_seq1/m.46828 type:complete len:124 (-) comp24665_c0_seq1:311-682(-)
MSETKTVTFAEVAQHKDKKDIWFVINGKAYDVTPFLDEHPGGEEVLLEHAGADATQAFDDVGHSTDAISDLKKYYVADVEGATVTAPGKKAAKATQQGGSDFITYLIPIAVIAAAIYYKLYMA